VGGLYGADDDGPLVGSLEDGTTLGTLVGSDDVGGLEGADDDRPLVGSLENKRRHEGWRSFKRRLQLTSPPEVRTIHPQLSTWLSWEVKQQKLGLGSWGWRGGDERVEERSHVLHLPH
jgi:hypothetical protein